MQVSRRGLLINLLEVENIHHQDFDIDDIRVKFHYNYLFKRYFMSVYFNDTFLISNLMVVPNQDMFKNLYNEDVESIGELYFNLEDDYLDNASIEKTELLYVYPAGV